LYLKEKEIRFFRILQGIDEALETIGAKRFKAANYTFSRGESLRKCCNLYEGDPQNYLAVIDFKLQRGRELWMVQSSSSTVADDWKEYNTEEDRAWGEANGVEDGKALAWQLEQMNRPGYRYRATWEDARAVFLHREIPILYGERPLINVILALGSQFSGQNLDAVSGEAVIRAMLEAGVLEPTEKTYRQQLMGILKSGGQARIESKSITVRTRHFSPRSFFRTIARNTDRKFRSNNDESRFQVGNFVFTHFSKGVDLATKPEAIATLELRTTAGKTERFLVEIEKKKPTVSASPVIPLDFLENPQEFKEQFNRGTSHSYDKSVDQKTWKELCVYLKGHIGDTDVFFATQHPYRDRRLLRRIKQEPDEGKTALVAISEKLGDSDVSIEEIEAEAIIRMWRMAGLIKRHESDSRTGGPTIFNLILQPTLDVMKRILANRTVFPMQLSGKFSFSVKPYLLPILKNKLQLTQEDIGRLERYIDGLYAETGNRGSSVPSRAKEEFAQIVCERSAAASSVKPMTITEVRHATHGGMLDLEKDKRLYILTGLGIPWTDLGARILTPVSADDQETFWQDMFQQPFKGRFSDEVFSARLRQNRNVALRVRRVYEGWSQEKIEKIIESNQDKPGFVDLLIVSHPGARDFAYTIEAAMPLKPEKKPSTRIEHGSKVGYQIKMDKSPKRAKSKHAITQEVRSKVLASFRTAFNNGNRTKASPFTALGVTGAYQLQTILPIDRVRDLWGKALLLSEEDFEPEDFSANLRSDPNIQLSVIREDRYQNVDKLARRYNNDRHFVMGLQVVHPGGQRSVYKILYSIATQNIEQLERMSNEIFGERVIFERGEIVRPKGSDWVKGTGYEKRTPKIPYVRITGRRGAKNAPQTAIGIASELIGDSGLNFGEKDGVSLIRGGNGMIINFTDWNGPGEGQLRSAMATYDEGDDHGGVGRRIAVATFIGYDTRRRKETTLHGVIYAPPSSAASPVSDLESSDSTRGGIDLQSIETRTAAGSQAVDSRYFNQAASNIFNASLEGITFQIISIDRIEDIDRFF